jgi:hypothetical protein
MSKVKELTTADIDTLIEAAESERASLEQRQRSISQEIGANYGDHNPALEVEFGSIGARLSGLAIHLDNLRARRSMAATSETMEVYRQASGLVHQTYSAMHAIDTEIKAHQQIIEDLTQRRSKLEFEDLQSAQSRRERAMKAALEAGNTREQLGAVNREFPSIGIYW